MKSKPLKFRFQATLVDEDENGEIVNTVELEPVEFIGKAGLAAGLPQHLGDIDQLCATRSAELTLQAAAQPNRRTRRGRGGKAKAA